MDLFGVWLAGWFCKCALSPTFRLLSSHLPSFPTDHPDDLLTWNQHRPLSLTAIVQRSKLILDFALTTHFIHLVVVTLYTTPEWTLPRHTAWWLAMGISCLASFLLGSWGCRYRELQPIAFGGHGNNAASNNNNTNGRDGGGLGDEEQGFITGGRGGRTKRGSRGDLAGDYEMATIAGPSGGGGGASGSGSGSGKGHARSQSTVSQAGGLGGPVHKAD